MDFVHLGVSKLPLSETSVIRLLRGSMHGEASGETVGEILGEVSGDTSGVDPGFLRVDV